MDLYEVVRRPVITEKSSRLQAEGKYVFEVASGATKPQVQQAVEKAFNVGVVRVNMMTVPGSEKRVGRRHVRTSAWKKAIVTLQAGDKIELFENV